MSIKHLKPNLSINPSNNGQTLANVAANYFVTMANSDYFSVTLPDVAVMAGESLTFTTVNSTFESSFSINGPIHLSDSSYSLSIPSSVTFLSDGNRWWIIAAYSG